MIKSIEFSNKQLDEIKKHRINGHTAESTVHIITIDGEEKILKLFINKEDISNKIKKIVLIKDRVKNNSCVVTADKIVTNNGEPIGYIMPFIQGNNLSDLPIMKTKDKIDILKKISVELKRLHKLNIVVADFGNNTLIDKDGNIHFIDYDNFSIDDLYVDIENMHLKEYKKFVKTFDQRFDNYLLNILTIYALSKISTKYLKSIYEQNPFRIHFKDNSINDLVYKTFNLGKIYDCGLIVDEINSKQDLKKVRLKKF